MSSLVIVEMSAWDCDILQCALTFDKKTRGTVNSEVGQTFCLTSDICQPTLPESYLFNVLSSEHKINLGLL